MIFTPTPLSGSFLIAPEPRRDDRGFFARVFCAGEFAAHSLETTFVQMNTSFSRAERTLRGMHFQTGSAAEVKVVRCTAGAVYDVIMDLRRASKTYGRYFGVRLTAENRHMLYVPRGFAHGFLTLSENAEVFYLVSALYTPAAERGIRYNDPSFAVEWPSTPAEISDKDAAWPDFDLATDGL
jgi:dTDP-4-dehydrorhamnose 3,5-epimerase